MIFNKNGVRRSNFKFSAQDIETLRETWQVHSEKKFKIPRDLSGKGIVYTAGNVKYITCAWVSISLLRSLNCNLPIELWYLGNELSEGIISKFKCLNVDFRNFNQLGQTDLFGYMLKPLAIINSRFKEVLYLDADNNCIKDPEYLFYTDEYNKFGCLFWPDYFYTSKDNSIWSIINIKPNRDLEQESGQILINKEKHWKELQLCLHFNKLASYYYNILLGDKDTFKFAWLALKSKFYMVPHMPGTCGYKIKNKFYGNTMVQHDPAGNILFLHRNLLKWDVTYQDEICWKYIKRVQVNDKKAQIVIRKGLRKGWLGIDFTGQVDELLFSDVCPDIETLCLTYLQQFRNSLEYNIFANEFYIRSNRPI